MTGRATRLRARLPGGAFASTFCSFAAFGVFSGAWQVLLAELKGAFALTPGAVGALLTAGVVVSLPAMVLGGRVIDRVGPRRVVAATGLLVALGLAGFASAGTYLALFPVIALYNAGSGCFDVGMNSAAMDVERAAEGAVMSYFHAAYSGFAATGALLAGWALGVGAAYRTVYLGVALAPLAVTVLLVATDHYPARSAETADADGDRDADAGARSLFFDPVVLLVAVVVACSFFAEGAMTDWSTIYVQGALGVPVSMGAAGVAAFHAAMTAGRLGGVWATNAFASRRLLQAFGVLGAAGMALALATDVLPLVVLGFAVVGIAMAVVAPLGFSIAGELAGGRSGEASSVVTFVGYGAFLVGPVLIGGVAEAATLRAALALVAVAAVAITLLATRLPDVD